MNQPEIQNRTPFAFEPMFVADEELRPIVVPILKATFAIGEKGALSLAEEQPPVDFEGSYHGEPGESSPRTEPETALAKPATDTALVGHAHPRRAGDTEVEVVFRVGELRRRARVTGDRVWERRRLGIQAGKAKPFEAVPLTWERAFGGWDRSHEDPEKHSFEPRNPVGVGFRQRGAPFGEGMALPNIEDPERSQESFLGRAAPVGFGFTAPHWEPRRHLAGTYDEAWQKGRMPLLPADFQRAFFNAAAPGLRAPGHLLGDEPVLVLGASPEGRLRFDLPAVAEPTCRLAFRHGAPETVALDLDTVIVDTDERRLTLLWRRPAGLRREPHEVREIEVRSANYEKEA